MVKTIGIISIKGGVGKTTVASSLACDLANHHCKKVLLVDGNYSAPNLGIHMDLINPDKTIHDVLEGKVKASNAVYNRFGVDVIPGRYNYNNNLNVLKLRDKIDSIKKNYDFVILDSSPSLNEEVLSVMLASDNLFVVSTPDYPTLSCSLKAAKLAKQRGKPISGIIINKIRDPKYELELEDIQGILDIPVVAKIKDDKNNTGSLFMRIPMSVYHKNSKFSRELGHLTHAILGKKEKRGLFGSLIPANFRKEQVNRQLLRKDFYNRSFKE